MMFINNVTRLACFLPETCPLLPMPGDPNARLSTWSTNYLTTVTEVCVPGYAPLEPDNQGKKTCSSGQRWVDDPYNGTPVECTREYAITTTTFYLYTRLCLLDTISETETYRRTRHRPSTRIHQYVPS